MLEEIIRNLKKENQKLLHIIDSLRHKNKEVVVLESNIGIIPKYNSGDTVYYHENYIYGYDVEIVNVSGYSGKIPLYQVINHRNGQTMRFIEETKLLPK